MDRRTFITLVEKYREGTAHSSEITLLEAYYKQLESSGYAGFTEEEARILKEISYRNIADRVTVGTKKAPGKSIRRYWLVAAIIAGTVILSGAGYFFMDEHKKSADGQVAFGKEEIDFHPAASGAVLTLADGSTVLLDSITNGQIAEQGSSRVIKDNGRIVYDSRLMPGGTPVSYNTISTPYGRQCNVVLPDSTVVYLNAGSSLTFATAFTGKERNVKFSGEAYFKIAKNAGRPFIVNVNGINVEALGTEFNINSYADETLAKTTLVEGSIKVSIGSAHAALEPGQQSVVNNAGEIELVLKADMEKILAWKNNIFLFEGDELTDIMKQLARWYDVEIVYEGKIPGHHFSGIISRQRKLSAVLNLLKATESIDFKIDGKKIIVYP